MRHGGVGYDTHGVFGDVCVVQIDRTARNIGVEVGGEGGAVDKGVRQILGHLQTVSTHGAVFVLQDGEGIIFVDVSGAAGYSTVEYLQGLHLYIRLEKLGDVHSWYGVGEGHLVFVVLIGNTPRA